MAISQLAVYQGSDKKIYGQYINLSNDTVYFHYGSKVLFEVDSHGVASLHESSKPARVIGRFRYSYLENRSGRIAYEPEDGPVEEFSTRDFITAEYQLFCTMVEAGLFAELTGD